MATIWYAQKTDNINAANVFNDTQDGSGNWFTWHAAYDAGDEYVAGNKVQHTVSGGVLTWYNATDANGSADPKEPGAAGSDGYWEEVFTGDSFRANEYVITVNVDVPKCLQLDSVPRVLDAYDADTTYAINDRVQHTHSGVLRQYKSLQNANTGNTPPATESTAWWEYVTGGYFTAADTRTVNANFVSGTNGSTGVINYTGTTPNVFTITGSVTAGHVITTVSAERAYGAWNNSTGTLTIGNDSTGGSGSAAFGSYNFSSGTLTIGNDSTGGSGSSAYGSYNSSGGTVNIGNDSIGGSGNSAIGSVNSSGTLTIGNNSTGGSGSSAYGSYNSSGGTVNIGNDSIGGSGNSAYGSFNYSTGTVNIGNNCTGGSGSAAFGSYNYSNGTLTIGNDCTGGSGSSAHGSFNYSNGTLTIGNDCTGGLGSSAHGSYNFSNGTITIGGNTTGHVSTATNYGLYQRAAGIATIGGNVLKQAADGVYEFATTSTVTLNGTGTQTWTQDTARSVGNVAIAKASGKVVFATAMTCTNLTLTGPARVEQTGDRTITVSGNYAATGTAENPVYWLGPNLIITGTATGTHCYVAGSDATGGTIITCTNSACDNSPGWFCTVPSIADIEAMLTARGVTLPASDGNDSILRRGTDTVTGTSIITYVGALTGDTGVPLTKAVEMIAALATGKVTKAIVGSDTVLTYYKRDGSTVSFVVTADSTDATRATAGSLS